MSVFFENKWCWFFKFTNWLLFKFHLPSHDYDPCRFFNSTLTIFRYFTRVQCSSLYVLWYKFIIAGIHPFLLENIRVLVSGCVRHIEIHFVEMKCSPRYTHCAWNCGNARASFDLKSKSLVNDAWDLFHVRCVAETKHLFPNVRSSNIYNNSLLQILKYYGNRYFFLFLPTFRI